MTGAPKSPAPVSPDRALRRLFLTLFLRGRSLRGMKAGEAPKSIPERLAVTLALYTGFGAFALFCRDQPVLVLAIYLHAMTFLCLGMFVSVSAGDVLFNRDEADILLHRPVPARSLLRAKVSVLVQVSLWIAGALNLVGAFLGVIAPDGGWRFPLIHAVSTVLEALLCTGSVIVIYELCLRWIGRERLDGLMTTMQVVVSVGIVLGSQIVPRLIGSDGERIALRDVPGWTALLPPVWFAGLDDAVAGSGAGRSWVMGAAGLAATIVVLWLALTKLAGAYHTGLKTIGEAPPTRSRGHRRFRLKTLTGLPPVRFWLRDPVARGSFLLTAAYMLRDREVKLRLYPGIASMLVIPVFSFVRYRGHDAAGNFGLIFSGMYLGIIPLLALDTVRYSQQWQAADIFRAAPIAGPAPLCHGARRAVALLLVIPAVLIFAIVVFLMNRSPGQLPLLLPGVVALPVYAMIPCLNGKSVPFARAYDDARPFRHMAEFIGVLAVAAIISGIGTVAWSNGWFHWFLTVELGVCGTVWWAMRRLVDQTSWASAD